MQGFTQWLCRLCVLLACFVCASGYAAPAYARAPEGALRPYAQLSSAEDLASITAEDRGLGSDIGAESTGSDFSERDDDDDDDCDEESQAVVTGQGTEPLNRECQAVHPWPVSAPVVSGHHALDPRPPRLF